MPALPGCTASAASDELGPTADSSGTPDHGLAGRVPPRRRWWQLRPSAASEDGMTTAEYAVGTVAACGFAGILYKTVTSDVVAGLVAEIIRRALTLSF